MRPHQYSILLHLPISSKASGGIRNTGDVSRWTSRGPFRLRRVLIFYSVLVQHGVEIALGKRIGRIL